MWMMGIKEKKQQS